MAICIDSPTCCASFDKIYFSICFYIVYGDKTLSVTKSASEIYKALTSSLQDIIGVDCAQADQRNIPVYYMLDREIP